MAHEETDAAEHPAKRSKLPIIIGLVLMLTGGGAAFFAVNKGLILPELHNAEVPHTDLARDELAEIAFVPLDPMVISLAVGDARHLRFSAQLEVAKAHFDDVEMLKPRVMDVLNGYLRAVDVVELADPAAMIRLRAQMLRRIQIVTGEGRVRDLLIIEFVLN